MSCSSSHIKWCPGGRFDWNRVGIRCKTLSGSSWCCPCWRWKRSHITWCVMLSNYNLKTAMGTSLQLLYVPSQYTLLNNTAQSKHPQPDWNRKKLSLQFDWHACSYRIAIQQIPNLFTVSKFANNQSFAVWTYGKSFLQKHGFLFLLEIWNV